MKMILFALSFWSFSAFAAPPFLDPLPKWAQDSLYSGVYLDIAYVTKTESLSFFQATEVQNQMRDLIESAGLPEAEAYTRALAQVRGGTNESGWSPVDFQSPADFVAVIDLDETLLVQWHATGAEGNFDLSDVPADRSSGPNGEEIRSGTYVKFTPNTEAFLRGLRANPNCKGIVLFSAKVDDAVHGIVDKWRFADGTPVRSFVNGVFTRNHLVVGTGNLIPSKDMRIFDPELKHVVIIDDNPARIVQSLQTLAQPKFDADRYWKAKNDGDVLVSKYYEDILPLSLANLNETTFAANRLGLSFGESFKAHSYFGERVTKAFLQSTGSRVQALEATRLHPFLHSASFVPVTNGPRRLNF